ncbi:GNAT family N-acetyltransferase [Fructilactobacillus vespulae]|uniref:GNAT family N-acetyltransferase n=1 Tax=Fructilactobacillus vespulae TaxID=1249630 RepID=UPI0039B50D60
MELVNRQIKINELEQLKRIIDLAYQKDEELGINFKTGQQSFSEFKQASESLTTFVAMNGNEIVSTVSVRYPWSANPSPYQIPHLGWIATNPKYFHQGHSTELIKWVEDNFLKKVEHVDAVSLGTAVEHPWLVDFYQKLGYETIETKRKFADHLTVYLIKIFNKALVNDYSKLKQLGLLNLYRKEK